MPAIEPNLLKFECPHCQQHMACEQAHAGQLMVCPTCQGGLQIPWVPQPDKPLSLKARTPPATHEPLYPRPASVDVWTEEEWNEHVSGMERSAFKQRIRQPVVWIGLGFLLLQVAALIPMLPQFFELLRWLHQAGHLNALAALALPIALLIYLDGLRDGHRSGTWSVLNWLRRIMK